MNITFERARQTGLDTENLFVNLCQGVKELCWRDNGLLPAMSGLNYPFSRHWPWTGREEFM